MRLAIQQVAAIVNLASHEHSQTSEFGRLKKSAEYESRPYEGRGYQSRTRDTQLVDSSSDFERVTCWKRNLVKARNDLTNR